MSNFNKQSLFFKGIFEFEDASGTLLASRIPQKGSLDLYRGSAVNIRPNQSALFIFKGRIADELSAGLHELNEGTTPILSRLVGAKYFFQSQFRGEIWFFSHQEFQSRRWGTARPVIHSLPDVGSIPLRSFGQFSIRVDSPKALLMTLIGSRSAYDITELEAWVQGEILENLPRALSEVQNLDDLGRSQEKVALRLRELVQAKLQSAGVSLTDLQVLSILPSQEVLKALDERKAMSLIGDPRQYLLYKAANSLDALHASGSSDGMQMMLGLMLGKGLLQGPQVLSSSDLSKPTQKQLLGDC